MEIKSLREALRKFTEENYQYLFSNTTSRLCYSIGLIANTVAPTKANLNTMCTQCIGYLYALIDTDQINDIYARELIDLLREIRDVKEDTQCQQKS